MNSPVDHFRRGLGELLEECQAIERTLPRDNYAARTVVYSLKEKIEQIITEFEDTQPAAQTSGPLTPREQEILALLAQGHANKEIAYRLSISPRTVQFHIKSLFEKLSAGSRTEVVANAIKNGLINI